MGGRTLGFTMEVEGAKKTLDNVSELKLELAKVNKELREAQKKGDTDTYKRVNKQAYELKEGIKDLNKELRDQKKAFNDGKVPEDSLIGLRKRYRELRKEVDGLSTTDPKFKEKSKQAKELAEQINSTSQELGSFKDNIGNYTGSILEALGGTQSFGGGLTQMMGGLKDFSGLAVGLPGIIGLVGGALVGLGDYVYQTTLEFEKLRSEVGQFVEGTPQEIERVLIATKSLAETMQIEFADTAQGIGIIQEQLDVSADKAAELMESGLFAVAESRRPDFLSAVNTELKQLAGLGIEPDSVIALLAETTDRNINVDILAEPLIRLREATPTTVEALEAAFGRENTEKLFSTFKEAPLEAIQAISEGLAELPPQSQEAGLILADVFSASGEDAVVTARKIGEIETVLGNLINLEDEYTARQMLELQVTKELNNAKSQLSLQLTGLGQQFGVFGKQIQVGAVQALTQFILKIRAIGATISNFLAGKFQAVTIFDIIADDAERAVKASEDITEATDKTGSDLNKILSDYAKTNKEIFSTFRTPLKKGIELTEGSLGFLKDQIKTLKQELEASNDISFIEKTSIELVKLQKEFEQAEHTLNQFKVQAEGRKGISSFDGLGLKDVPDQLSQVKDETDKVFENFKKRQEKESEQLRQQRQADREAQIQEQKQLMNDLVMGGTFDTFGQISDAIFEKSFENIEAEKNTRIATLEEEYAKRLELAEGDVEAQKSIKKQLEIEKQKIERQALKQKQATSIKEALINAALAITKTMANLGFPAGLIASAIVAAQTAVQIATIKAQKFEKGGVIDGKPHSMGGEKYISLSGNAIELEGGEGVINKRSMQSKRVYNLSGTPKQIASMLNIAEGGVAFDAFSRSRFQSGGIIPQLINPNPIVSANSLASFTDQQVEILAGRIANQNAIQTSAAIERSIIEADKVNNRRRNLSKNIGI